MVPKRLTEIVAGEILNLTSQCWNIISSNETHRETIVDRFRSILSLPQRDLEALLDRFKGKLKSERFSSKNDKNSDDSSSCKYLAANRFVCYLLKHQSEGINTSESICSSNGYFNRTIFQRAKMLGNFCNQLIELELSKSISNWDIILFALVIQYYILNFAIMHAKRGSPFKYISEYSKQISSTIKELLCCHGNQDNQDRPNNIPYFSSEVLKSENEGERNENSSQKFRAEGILELVTYVSGYTRSRQCIDGDATIDLYIHEITQLMTLIKEAVDLCKIFFPDFQNYLNSAKTKFASSCFSACSFVLSSSENFQFDSSLMVTKAIEETSKIVQEKIGSCFLLRTPLLIEFWKSVFFKDEFSARLFLELFIQVLKEIHLKKSIGSIVPQVNGVVS